MAATSAHNDCGGNQNPGLPEMPALVAEAEDHNPATSGENTPNYVPAEGTAEAHTATPMQRLAHTGFGAGTIALGALAVLAAGVIALTVARRRA